MCKHKNVKELGGSCGRIYILECWLTLSNDQFQVMTVGVVGCSRIEVQVIDIKKGNKL